MIWARCFLKYGCSSGDINPVGSINKHDLRALLRWASSNLGYSSLAQVEAAPCDAEVASIEMTDEELSVYGRLRKILRCGPVSMFQVCVGIFNYIYMMMEKRRNILNWMIFSLQFLKQNLCHKWGAKLSPLEISDKVKHFFECYSTNRHKMTVLTPSYLVQVIFIIRVA